MKFCMTGQEKGKSILTKDVLRGHLWDTENVVFEDRWPLKRGSIHMKFV